MTHPNGPQFLGDHLPLGCFIRNWPGAFSVHVDLYTAHGRSTNVVAMTVLEKNGRPVIELDDIVQR